LQQRSLIRQGPFAAAAAPGHTSAMTIDRAGLLRRLDQLGIAHTTCADRPVCTVEAAELRPGRLPGGHRNGRLLEDKKGGLWLLICLDQRRIDLNRLAEVPGGARLSGTRQTCSRRFLAWPRRRDVTCLGNDCARWVQPLLDRATCPPLTTIR
jgi:Ala-tRNA(Pro) deacylase